MLGVIVQGLERRVYNYVFTVSGPEFEFSVGSWLSYYEIVQIKTSHAQKATKEEDIAFCLRV